MQTPDVLMTAEPIERSPLSQERPTETAARPLKVIRPEAEHSQAKVCLWLSYDRSRGRSELTKVLFMYSPLNLSIQSVRGRFSGAYPGASTFQWTSAVQALSVALIRAAARRMTENSEPLLAGQKGTLASSLDDALYKQTSWLCDVFGADSRGQSLANKLFKRTNPGKKQAGPVTFSLNTNVLPGHAITVLLDDAEVTDPIRLESQANVIEELWTKEKALRSGTSEAGREELKARRSRVVVKPVSSVQSIVFISPAMESKPFYADALEKVVIGVGRLEKPGYIAIPKLPSRSFNDVELWGIFQDVFSGHISSDAVILIPDDPDKHREEILAFWRKKDVPLVLFDVDINRSGLQPGEAPPFVGADESCGGTIAGRMLAEHFQESRLERPEILVVKGTSTGWESGRIQGFSIEMLGKYPEANISETEDLYYDRARAARAALETFSKLSQGGSVTLDGIFACNDDMALGVRSAIIQAENNGLKFRKHLKIVGYDGVKEMRNYIDNRDKWILGTVDVKLEEQISLCLQLIRKMLEEGTRNPGSIVVEPCKYDGMRFGRMA